MTSGFRVGRILGINIAIDWSWLFIFALITWNLGSVFATLHPGWEPLLRWGVALAAALLFFASVLLHELAHSLVAKARGIPVRNITLFLFGGVSNIQRNPERPQSEFLMSIVGPLTSLILGGVLLALAAVTARIPGDAVLSPAEVLAQLSPVSTILMWLGSINLLLGIFNLIPGFPLDGGRVLRSLFWAVSNNLERATQWASLIGQGIAWAMILAGAAMAFGVQIPFLGTGLINGLWLAFIGWFLRNAAIQSYQQVLIEDALEGVPVSNLMRTDTPTVSPSSSVSSVVHEYAVAADDLAFPVMDYGKLVGMVTLEGIRSVAREAWDDTAVSTIMTPVEELETVSSDDDVADALNKLMQHDVGELPVVDDGKLAGVLTRRDIARWLKVETDRSGDGETAA